MTEHDLLSIAALLERERDPDLQQVLHHYREAEIALQHAIEHLRSCDRHRWAMATSSRSNDLRIQANRYIRQERRSLQLPTPESEQTPSNTCPPSLTEAEIHTLFECWRTENPQLKSEQPEPKPTTKLPLEPHERHKRWMRWLGYVVCGVILAAIVLPLIVDEIVHWFWSFG